MTAAALKDYVEKVGNIIAPAGTRPPFHEQKSPREALAWWTRHIDDPVGRKVLAGYTPIQVAQLKAWLAHAQQAMLPHLQPVAPVRPAGMNTGGAASLLSSGITAKRHMEGPPAGSEVA